MTYLSGRRVRMGAGVLTTLLVGAILGIELFGAPDLGPVASPIAPTESATPSTAVLGETSAPTEPSPTPEGTPAPPPTAAVDTPASVEVRTPSPAPRATPTPNPEPGLWRVQGYVVDENGDPLRSVCVVVGPRGCQRYSPHTDERGHWSLDVAATKPGDPETAFDFYFEMPGRETIWWHVIPAGPVDFNVVLHRT